MLDFKRLNTADEKYAEYLTDFRDNHRRYLQDLAQKIFDSNSDIDRMRFSIRNDFEWFKTATSLQVGSMSVKLDQNLRDEFNDFIERHEQTLCDIYNVGENEIWFVFRRGEEMQVIFPAEKNRSWD